MPAVQRGCAYDLPGVLQVCGCLNRFTSASHSSRYGLPGGANHTLALELYEQAAALADPEALTALAWMHAAGQGTPRDLPRAQALCRQAVDAAYDGASEVAPLLVSWWIAGLSTLDWVLGMRVLGGAHASFGGVRQDVVNIGVLLGALCLVLCLRGQLRGNGVRPARRPGQYRLT